MKPPPVFDAYRSYQDDARDWAKIVEQSSRAELVALLDVDVIYVLDPNTRVARLCYGAATLERISKSNKAERIRVLPLFVDCATPGGDLKKLLDLIKTVKGSHEYVKG